MQRRLEGLQAVSRGAPIDCDNHPFLSFFWHVLEAPDFRPFWFFIAAVSLLLRIFLSAQGIDEVKLVLLHGSCSRTCIQMDWSQSNI